MEGVPDLSALLKGKLQFLSKKPSSAATSGTVEPSPANENVNVEPSAPRPKTKTTKKTKAKKTAAEGHQSAPLDENASLEGAPSSAQAFKDSRKKKKKGGKKRSREESAGEREGNADGPSKTCPNEEVPEGRPKKKASSRSVENKAHTSVDGALSSDNARGGSPSSETPSEKRKRASASGGEPWSESAASERANSAASERITPVSAARGGSQSGGSLAKRARVEFPDRVQFSYEEKTLLVFNPSNAQS
ncbi:serine/arginine repetitive matrix protein 1-like [Brassica napus]|uniref:serine/arginine repetitive matrix protein 1-like n=1 Tax=Brassica oleracea var. oleracea TaxID=109376 RepID=UPI0006A7359F|nr:PREDICTED: serine/arginine repetitive matrix protein 1-like [Brassica oleracea var. oleracea]XP_048604986.1 serine/arginine repetitive matrix protein 1-like [Brassica napus]